MINRRVLIGGSIVMVAQTAVAQSRPRISVLSGSVTVRNYVKLESFLSRNLDKIVGLKIYFDSASHPAPLVAGVSEKRFVAYKRIPETTSEIVASDGFYWLHGGYQFDGYFVVKSGGMHQGVISYGLQKVPEDRVILSNPDLRPVQL